MVLGAWTMEEDAALSIAVSVHGPRQWTRIAELVHGRISKQCRERWLSQLRPGINRSEFSPCEDEILLTSVAERGTCWAKISLVPFGRKRSDSQLKNRYHVLQGRIYRGLVAKGWDDHTTSRAFIKKQKQKRDKEMALSNQADILELADFDRILAGLDGANGPAKPDPVAPVAANLVAAAEAPTVEVWEVHKTAVAATQTPTFREHRQLPPPIKTMCGWVTVINGSATGMRAPDSEIGPFTFINCALRSALRT